LKTLSPYKVQSSDILPEKEEFQSESAQIQRIGGGHPLQPGHRIQPEGDKFLPECPEKDFPKPAGA